MKGTVQTVGVLASTQVESSTSSAPREEASVASWPTFVSLLALLLFLSAWDLWALSLDQIYRGSDTYLDGIITLDALSKGVGHPGGGVAQWPKGPVAPMLGWLLLQLVGSAWAAGRLLAILCHLVLVFQCHDLGRRLGGSHRAGLLSAAMCGLSPMVYGWGRLAYHDILVAVVVALSLQIMLRVDLSRWRHAALLGLVLGAGVMTKLSFVIFMFAPVIWFLVTRVRKRRQVVGLGVMGLAMLGTSGWWLWTVCPKAGTYASQSLVKAGEDPWWNGLYHYLGLPGLGLLLAGSLAGVLALWGWRRAVRSTLVLLAGTVLISLLVHGLFLHFWSRYIVPLVPLAAVLAGAGLAVALARLPTVWARAVSWGVTAALVGAFVGTNLVGDKPSPGRAEGAGMVTPDARLYRGFPQAGRAWGLEPRELTWAFDSSLASAASNGVDVLWSTRGLALTGVHALSPGQVGPLAVMLVRYQPDIPMEQVPMDAKPHDVEVNVASWLIKQKNARRIWTSMDPDGLVFQAYWVGK